MTTNKITTREASSIQEKRIAKKLNGTVTPNSGAGLWDKSDVKIEDASLFIECKTCISPKKSFSIKKEWLEKNEKEAFINRMSNHVIAFNFDYSDKKDYYVIDDKLMKFLIDQLTKQD